MLRHPCLDEAERGHAARVLCRHGVQSPIPCTKQKHSGGSTPRIERTPRERRHPRMLLSGIHEHGTKQDGFPPDASTGGHRSSCLAAKHWHPGGTAPPEEQPRHLPQSRDTQDYFAMILDDAMTDTFTMICR